MKKLLACLCLDSFRCRLDEQFSCLALAGSRRLFVFINSGRFVEVGRLVNISFFSEIPSSFLHFFETPTQYTVLFTVFSLLDFFLFFNAIFCRGRTNIGFVRRPFFPSRTSKHLSGSISDGAAKRAPSRRRHFPCSTWLGSSILRDIFCVMFPPY